MPTQEERLKTVEYGLNQFKTETIKAYQDMAMETIIVKGLGEDSIKRLTRLQTTMEQRFENVDQRLSGVEQRLGTLERDMSEVKQRLSRVESLLTQILERLPNSR
ncbi:MAG: hypothetical protein NVSMB38_32290 [Ktedonobacteraceae bacterium]